MSFDPLFPILGEDKPKKVKKAEAPRGCEVCPLNKVPGVNKIMGRIRGRKILLIAQSPGPQENDEGTELVGPSGALIWRELGNVGIKRTDVDIQNTIRCFPADVQKHTYSTALKMRSPSKEEIRCCSIHTEAALEKSKASFILVLGQVAAKALLGVRSLPANKCFWSDKLKARVYLVDHPSFFVRGYGKGPRMDAFRQTLQRLANDYTGGAETEELADPYAFIRKQDYRLVTTREQAIEARNCIKEYVAKGRRISVDVEDDVFEDGIQHVIGVGLCPRPGLSFFFVLRHPELNGSMKVRMVLQELLEDPEIEKTFHYGCTDVTKLKELEEITVRGFTHDTNMSEFLRFSDKKAYGLDVLAEQRFPQFSGWKLLIVKEMMEAHRRADYSEAPKLPAVFNQSPDAQIKYISRKKLFHIRHCSLETLRLYNGADCDVGKRLEMDNKKHVPQALMRLYIDLSFILMKMETRGPYFDYEQHTKLAVLYPYKVKLLLRKARKLLGDKKFNPGSPQQVYKALYKTLGMEYPFSDGKKPHTGKMVLLMLGREHEFPKVVMEWRAASKVKSTYLDSYERCARANKNRLRTRWWASGTRTGRLSSGGEKHKKESTIINLQNVKKDTQIQNLCVADRRWRVAYDGIDALVSEHNRVTKNHSVTEAALGMLETKIEAWITEHIPDLYTYLLFDYGQVEVRVAAQMSGDENLIADCASGDIHSLVGAAMTGWDVEKIKNDIPTRTLTKNVHFGILFGLRKKNLYKFVVAMSPEEMRDRITEEEIYEAYDRYFARYFKVRQFIDSQIEFGFKHNYVKTLFGMFQTINVTDTTDDDDLEFVGEELDTRKASWRNQCANGPVQGTAHQLMICALVNLIRKRKKYRVLGIPPMEVHDALYFRVKVLELLVAYRKGKYLLEKESLKTVASDFPDIKWRVPIVVEAEGGLRLGTKTDVDEKTTVGGFMLAWYHKTKKQIAELDQELLAVAEAG